MDFADLPAGLFGFMAAHYDGIYVFVGKDALSVVPVSVVLAVESRRAMTFDPFGMIGSEYAEPPLAVVTVGLLGATIERYTFEPQEQIVARLRERGWGGGEGRSS